jgi:UDP-N-acetylglucosamine 2-epimerase (non-hydrolysing)
MAPVLATCERRGLSASLVMTGQHHETIDDLIEEFGITTVPEWSVRRRERATIGSLLRWAPEAYLAIVKHLRRVSTQAPIDVLVHGDTLSTLLAALAARHCGARVVHVESGLTSGKLLDPFPEEMFRRIVFRLSQVAMCPSEEAAEYMRRLGCSHVVNTHANTVVDAVRMVGAIGSGIGEDRKIVVVSLHRFQNIYDAVRLRQLESLIIALSEEFRVHFILHPATRKRLDANGGLERMRERKGIHLSPRLPYGEFLRLASDSQCVLTDGGSNQEELAVLGIPTIVMRASTERLDGLGRNAIMEADVEGGVLAFLTSGDYRRLRYRADTRPPTMPSEAIVSALIA